MTKTVLFRCDGGRNIGMGHVMRCLCLADGLRDQGIKDISFLTYSPDQAAKKKIQDWEFKVVEAPEAGSESDLKFLVKSVKDLKDLSRSLLITDSYALTDRYLSEVKTTGIRVLSFDDEAKQSFPVNWVLNHNLGAEKLVYPKGTTAKILGGSKYFLLRKEFKNLIGKRIASKDFHLLVTMGGSDSNNQTKKVLEAIKGTKQKLKVTVVLGSAHPDVKGIQALAKSMSHQVQVVHDVPDLAAYLTDVNLAVPGGGTTCYEMAAVGIPNIMLVLADNQRRIAQMLNDFGCSKSLGWSQDVDDKKIAQTIEALLGQPEILKQMSARGPELVDGRGVDRVLEAILN